jgi:site-specific recombinase XerD
MPGNPGYKDQAQHDKDWVSFHNAQYEWAGKRAGKAVTHVDNTMRTAPVLKDLFRDLGQPEQAMAFPGIRGEPLTQFAFDLLLRKAVERALARCATLKKRRVSPHVVRHSTAMALLQSGVDIHRVMAGARKH